MKNLLLLWLLIYVITGNLAFAEKAMSPVLIAPINFAKSISKDSIKFTWQNIQNEVNAKVNGYRIIISENAQFNGYTPSTGRCNVTCVTSVINSTTFSTGLRSFNKTYYWRVQGLSPTENGEWSRTGTFKTDSSAPIITSASATPSSISLGSTINFSATLSSTLPSNHNVKLSYGSSTVNMAGTDTSYSVSQIPTQLGQQVFTVGVYDSNNALKGSVFKGNFEVIKSNSAPTLSLVDAATTATVGTNYSVQLQPNDVDNNLKSISLVWGDGVIDTQYATNGTTLTFTHAYAKANTYNWSATALDSGNASSSAIAKSVTVSAAVVTPPVSSSSYTKISNTGATLPDTAVLGSDSNDWACTKDNKTGLTWEVKTTDGGLRDMGKTYTNYFSGEAGYGVITNADFFVKEVNKQGLCGVNNWRLPTKEELEILFTKTSTVNKPINIPRYIDANYFPNTDHYGFWSSSPVTNISSNSWYGDFNLGFLDASDKSNAGDVRLVSEPTFSTTNYTKISNTGASLPDTAVLGSGSNDWACTKDNKTGLTWEVKTDDGGLRDENWTYSWYKPSGYNGGNAGHTDTTYGAPNCSTKNNCNTDAFTNAVNTKSLCGRNDWRMPTKDELMKLVVCSDGKYATDGSCINFLYVAQPTINSTYFPNTLSLQYWTSSPYAYSSVDAWGIYFFDGGSGSSRKDSSGFVRLVR